MHTVQNNGIAAGSVLPTGFCVYDLKRQFPGDTEGLDGNGDAPAFVFRLQTISLAHDLPESSQSRLERPGLRQFRSVGDGDLALDRKSVV